MANKQNRYAPEFRRQMVELARAGRTPAELSREFGPSAWTIALILTRGAELALDAGILDPTPNGQPGPRPIETLEAAESSHILKALEACGWRVSGKGGAADQLGLRPSTLDLRMKRLGIDRPA